MALKLNLDKLDQDYSAKTENAGFLCRPWKEAVCIGGQFMSGLRNYIVGTVKGIKLNADLKQLV
jgi:hypothetical protein